MPGHRRVMMVSKRSWGISLSTRVTLLTFVAMTVAVLVIALVSLVGVYNLTRSEDDSRLVAYRQLMLDDLASRLTIVDRVVDSLSAVIDTDSATPADVQRPVAMAASANAEYFDLIMCVDESGTVLAASTRDGAPRTLATAPFFRDRGSADSFFGWEDDHTSPARLWVVRRVGSGSLGYYVVGRVRTGFMARIADAVATTRESVSALIVDMHGDPVRVGVGSVGFDPRGVVYQQEGRGRGRASVESTSVGLLSGYYADVVTAPELKWRVVVFESDRDVFVRTRQALLPAAFVTFGAVLVAIAFALAYSRRLVSPLRLLERRARAVASGGYVRPMRVDRDDELGRMADAFNEMGVRLNSLQEMAQLLASASNLDDVLDSVLNAVGHILGTGDAAIMLVDDDGETLTLARGRGLAVPAATFLVPLDEPSPITESYHEQRPATFAGASGEWTAAVHRLFGADSERAGVTVPLVMGRDVLGVILVLAPGALAFTDAQIETLRAFSANAAVAVHTSRLFEHEHISRTEAEALREVAELIVRPTDLGEALERAAAIAAGILGTGAWELAIEGREQLGLDRSDDPESERRLMRAWELVAPQAEPDSTARLDPVAVDDVHSKPALRSLLGRDAGSALFIPLTQGRAVRGVLVLLDPRRRPAPRPRRVVLAGTIGKQISLAIRNAYLLQQARNRAANLETVFRISQAVSSELQLNVVLNRVLDVVQKIFSADAVALMSYDPQRRLITTSMARGIANRDMLYFQVVPGHDIPGTVFESRTPAAHGELARVNTPLARLALAQDLHSLIVVPLLARGKPIGVLAVYACEPDAFSGEDMELLLTFAAQAALAIDTASLFGKEHHVASILQSSILPERLPEIDGLETASFYLPAGAEADIGGDYYDVFTTADGRIVLAIGDVCGKGVLAATKTSMIKYSLRGLVSAGVGPAQALTELNRLVALSGDPSDIVTAWVGFLDLEEHTLVYANGGHPAGLLWRRAKDRVMRLAPTGPLLGAVPGVAFDEHTIRVETGDLILLYTDGVTEARHASKFFGEGRVRRVLRRSATPDETVDLLLEAVQRFSAGPLRDDAAALVVKLTGEEARGSV